MSMMSNEKRNLDDVVLGAQSASPLADVPFATLSSASLPKAIVAGVVAALIGAGIWAGITIGTNY